jgi:hypothetical protein
MSENKIKKYYNQAVQFVTELRETLTLTSAVLDKCVLSASVHMTYKKFFLGIGFPASRKHPLVS